MVRDKIEEIVRVVSRSMGGAKCDYVLYDGKTYRYRIYYDGERTVDIINAVTECISLYLRIEYKPHGDKYYKTLCRTMINKQGNYNEIVDSVYCEVKEVILNMDCIDVYKDFFV